MPESSLQTKITADVTDLQVKAAIAKSETSAYSAAVRAAAKEVSAANEEMKSAAQAHLQQEVELLNEAKAKWAEYEAQIKASVNPEATGIFDRLGAKVKETTESVEGLTAKFQTFSKLTSAVSEFVLAGLGVEKVAEAIKSTAETGEQIGQMSEKTGVATETLSGLRVAAIETNTDFDTLGTGMRNLAKNVQEAIINPNSVAAQSFRAIGVSITDANGQMLPLDNILGQIATAYAGMADGTAKADLASDQFGAKVGSSLIPVLDKVGTVSIPVLTQQAKDMGVSFDAAAVEADAKFAESMKDAGITVEGLKDVVSNALIPALTVAETAFTDSSSGMSTMHAAAIALGDGLKVVVEVGAAVVTGVEEIYDAFFALGEEFGGVILGVESVTDVMNLDFHDAAIHMQEASTIMSNAWTDALDKMAAHEKTFADIHNALWNNVQTADVKTPDLPQAPQLGGHNSSVGAHQGGGSGPDIADQGDTGGVDAESGDGGVSNAKAAQDQITQIADAAASARKAIASSEYDAKVSNWDAEVAQGQMTKTQEIQNEIAAQNQIYQANLTEMQKEASLDATGSVAKAKELDDIQVLVAQHNAELAKMNTDLITQQLADAQKLKDEQDKAAAATAAAWQKAFQPIGQAFDSSINGVLQGTETLQQAELKAAQSIALAYIDAIAKQMVSFVASKAQMLAQTVATEAGMTSATVAGDASRLASQTTTEAAGRSASVALGTAQIAGDAAKAAAGAYSAVAGIPFVGPVLAPVAAATAYAAVTAYDVLSAEGGMAIPAGVNPLTQLHENEMVLPAYIAQPLTSMLQSTGDVSNSSVGDTHMHFNQTNHGVGGDTAGAMGKAGQAWMAQILDLSRNGTLRLPGR